MPALGPKSDGKAAEPVCIPAGATKFPGTDAEVRASILPAKAAQIKNPCWLTSRDSIKARLIQPLAFFKGTPSRVAAPKTDVRIRADSKWNVPEPELALLIGPRKNLVGFTLGNDMSSRDIEGENPLYLPQAKVYRASCALGPTILLADAVSDWRKLTIKIAINRNGKSVFEGETSLDKMKRTPQELIDWLFREDDFPAGVILLTGTGIIPPDNFTLAVGDRIAITCAELGTLENVVAS